MLLELELPRLLAPDLPSNCSSFVGLNLSHSNCTIQKNRALLCIVTTSPCRDWVICAPAAFLGCGSRFSGSLSGIEPLFPVTRCQLGRPLLYQQFDRAGIWMKHRRHKAMRFEKLLWITKERQAALVFYLINTPSKLGFSARISSRITTVIRVVREHQINYNWFNEPFAVSQYSCLYLDMHGLIFETSIWLLAGSTR